jgi:acetyl esterase/lipase
MKISDLRFYVKLYGVHRVARRFYRRYEHLAKDVPFHPEMQVRLDIYAQPTGKGYPVLVFVHGGRWSDFTKELFAPVAMKLLPEKMVVVIPDHTLYPKADYKQMTREVAAALSWTLENIAQYGGDPNRVTIAGHSSGGQLAGLAVMDSRFLQAYGHTSAEVCGMISASSGYDMQAQYEYEQAKGRRDLNRVMLEVMGGQENFGAASPINYVQPGLPPILLIHGDADQTIPVSQASGFHAALQEAGAQSELKIYPGRGHSEILLSALWEDHPRIVADFSEFVHS